jgi:hypothetical protein
MVFKKTIIQVYSGNNQFGFDDFVRGTLRLFNYAIDRDIDIKINISGSELEPYLLVTNYIYDAINIIPKVYYNEVDKVSLINDLDAFIASSEAIFVLTSNVTIDRSDIYNMSYIGYDKIIRYNESLYAAADVKVRANLLKTRISDNLKYGYSVVYFQKDDRYFNSTVRYISSLANQIRKSINMNHDIIVLSNIPKLGVILSNYIEMNTIAVQIVDDSDINIGPATSSPIITDIITDFIILLNAKKIFRFSHNPESSIHNIRFGYSSKTTYLFQAALDTNDILWNMKTVDTPLYYESHTLAGSPASSTLNRPSGIVFDNSGNLIIADTMNHCIKKLDPTGNLTIIAGTGSSGFVNGATTIAKFNSPTSLALDRLGNIYVADTGNNVIRIIELRFYKDSNNNTVHDYWLVNTLSGSVSISPIVSSGIGSGGLLNAPQGVAVDISGNLYVSDTGNHRICKFTGGGNLTTVAGITTLDGPLGYIRGYINGTVGEASFNEPTGLTLDIHGNIYVADTGNHVIRKIDINGNVTTVAGNAQPFFNDGPSNLASFNRPTDVAIDSEGVIYVADSLNNSIRSISEGIVSLVAGSPIQISGSIDGFGDRDPQRELVPPSNRATFNRPVSIIVNSSRKLFVADSLNNTVRDICPTFSDPIKIKPIPLQSFKIINAPGLAYTLGPTLSQPSKIPMIQGRRF